MRRSLIALLAAALGLLLLSQLQPRLLDARGAVDGSFGLRPVTHDCLGRRLSAGWVARWLPVADVGFRLGRFHFRYGVRPPEAGEARDYCLGQDIWYGE